MDTVTGAPSSRREDFWSEDATLTLIEAWGDRYLELNRGSLRQKHWQEVAHAVNDRHFHTTTNQSNRTDIQCKNRIDTLEKKYKIEKARLLDSNGAYTSPWPFFIRLDALLGTNFPYARTPEPATFRRFTPPIMAMSPVPVGPRSATPRRPATAPSPLAVDDSYCFHRQFPAFAAAAAAEVSARSTSRSDGESLSRRRRKRRGEREVAEAIERLGQIYERVEEKKQRQMVELEKQRMQFAKELECQRMQLIVETQVQLHKFECGATKRSSAAAEKLPPEREMDGASPHFGASWNLLPMKRYSFSCNLDGGLIF